MRARHFHMRFTAAEGCVLHSMHIVRLIVAIPHALQLYT